MNARSTSLRQEPAFVRWALAEGVSLAGSSVTTVVLPLIVYQATGSAAKTGALFALRVVPYLLFGLIAGPLADRGNRRLLIVGGNVVEGCLVATIPLAHVLGVLTVTQIYVVALLSATAFVFSDAAVFGAVPALVGPERLPAANGLLSSMASTAEIAGPVIAGVLVASIGTTNAVWVDSASFLAAAAVQWQIKSNFRSDAPVPERAGSDDSGQVRRAFRFIRGETTVRTLLIAGFGNSFAFGIVIGLMVPFAVERLGFADDDGRIGVLYGALGVGSLLAGLLFGRVFRTSRIRYLTPSALLLAALAVAAMLRATNWLAALAIVGAFSFGITLAVVIGITYRQLAAPDSLRSSVNVIGRMISWGGQPFGAFTGAIVAGLLDVEAAYAVAAAVMLVSAGFAAVALRRTGDHAVEEAQRGL